VAAWSFGAAEEKLNSVLLFTLTSPTLQAPLSLADNAVCYSLGFVENRIPALKQQPQEVQLKIPFFETRLFTNDVLFNTYY
jgi:hypothetical protein